MDWLLLDKQQLEHIFRSFTDLLARDDAWFLIQFPLPLAILLELRAELGL